MDPAAKSGHPCDEKACRDIADPAAMDQGFQILHVGRAVLAAQIRTRSVQRHYFYDSNGGGRLR